MKIKVQLNKLININDQQSCWFLLFVFVIGLNIFNTNIFSNFQSQKASFPATAFNKFSDYQIQSSQDLVNNNISSCRKNLSFFPAKLSNFSCVEFVVFDSEFNKTLLLNSNSHIISSDSEIKICFRV